VGSRVNARFEHFFLHTYIHTYVFIDLAAKLAGLWCTIYIKNIFLAFENYCVTVNTDRPITQRPSCSSGTLVSGNIKIMRVLAGVP